MNGIKFPHLMAPGVIGGIQVRNKIVMPAMGVNMADGGYVNEAIINHYAERAKGGAGLIVVEVTCVDTPLGLNTSRMLAIDDDKYIPGFKRLTETIHHHGAKCILEISHTGRGAKRRIIGAQPVGPSAIKKPYDFIVGFEGEEPRALTVEEIKTIEDKYAAAALRAQKAGFDGVEIHATGYYLVAQFFSATANHRTDGYGGNIYNRARFALNILLKIKAKVGESFPVFYKLSILEIGDYGGVKLRDGLLNCYLLQEAGAAAIEVLAGAWSTCPKKYDKPDSGQGRGLTFPIVRLMKLARIRKYARRPGFLFGRKLLTIPLITGGRTFDPVLAEKALARGWGDFIFMGRGLLAQPDLPRMIAAGTYEAARPCIGCGKCIDGQLQRDERICCSGNAALGVRDNDYTIPPASLKKRVYVIGGGPAGVEAARIAAIRGHEVTLFEKDGRLGGQLHAAVIPPHKQNLRLLLKYLEQQVAVSGVRVRLQTEMTAARILKEQPDVVICATGTQPVRLPIPGFEKPLVMDVGRLLDSSNPIAPVGGPPIGREVVIIGGGIIGCETAQMLAEKGKKVAIIDVLDRLALKMVATSRAILLAQLERLGVKVYLATQCKEIKDRSVVIEDQNGVQEELRADKVLVAVGARPNRELYSELEGKIRELYAVGDCLEPASVLEAVSTGYYTAMQI